MVLRRPGKDPKLALLPFAIVAVSAVISYERAKAESLGYDAKGGIMERAERLILLGVAMLGSEVFVEVVFLSLLGSCWRSRSSPPGSVSSRSGAKPARRSRYPRTPVARGGAGVSSPVGRRGASHGRRERGAARPLRAGCVPGAATSRSA